MVSNRWSECTGDPLKAVVVLSGRGMWSFHSSGSNKLNCWCGNVLISDSKARRCHAFVSWWAYGTNSLELRLNQERESHHSQLQLVTTSSPLKCISKRLNLLPSPSRAPLRCTESEEGELDWTWLIDGLGGWRVWLGDVSSMELDEAPSKGTLAINSHQSLTKLERVFASLTFDKKGTRRFQDFMIDFRCIANNCNFGTLPDRMLRDQLINH